MAVAMVARVAVAGLFAAVPALQPLRGPDELFFFDMARSFAEGGGGARPALLGEAHVWLFAGQLKLFGDVGGASLRIVQAGMAVAAIAVVAAAVYDLAGARAAHVTAWFLALEPSSVFFSGLLHKEASMLLAEAMVILGGVSMYRRRSAAAAVLLTGGVLVGVLTRPYAGSALAGAAVLVTLHAALRRVGPRPRRAPALALACIGAILLVPALAWQSDVLARLQASQNSNATGISNLAFEPIDYSSPAAVARNVPRRAAGFMLQPYPWQVANMSQRFGVVGTTVAWSLLAALIVLALTRAKRLVPAAPILYVALALTLAYALSTGNAGTGFRYRTHVVMTVAALVCTLAFDPRRRVPGLASETPGTGSSSAIVHRGADTGIS